MISDAPCHGKKYHDADDSYPNGCPKGLVLEDLMKEFYGKKIQFTFFPTMMATYYKLMFEKFCFIIYSLKDI